MASFGRWNFETPPGFRGMDVRQSVMRHSRHLPHWRQDGATYFVTFRLADSLPQVKLDQITRLRCHYLEEVEALKALGSHSADREIAELSMKLGRETMQKTEQWLDQGMGSCVLGDSQARLIVQQTITNGLKKSGHVGAMVVMPNHVHLLMRPAIGTGLEGILQQIKRGSARLINQLLKRSGSLWSGESYDRIVRDGEHLWRCLQYIGRNPRKAGLEQEKFTRWVDPEWEACGWGFTEDQGGTNLENAQRP